MIQGKLIYRRKLKMGFSNLSVNQYESVNRLSRYLIGASVNQQGESSGIVSGTAMMGGISAGTWAWKNRKDIRGGLNQLAADSKVQKAVVNKYVSKDASIWQNMKARWKGAGEYVSGVRTAETALVKASGEAAATAATGAATQTAAKATSKIGALAKGAGKSAWKCLKGNAGFAAISLGIGIVSDVVPAFKLGVGKGFKQLGKTALTTAAEVGGWAAGSAIGAKAGAAIGSFFGPAGTAIGGVLGFLGGMVGSFFCGKIAKKITGPSEVELAQKEATQDIAKSAIRDAGSTNQLIQESYNQLVQRAAAGQLTEDDMLAKAEIEKLIGQEIDLNAAVQQAA